MATQLILGATGSGKTTALATRYQDWVRSGVRTDEILVLTAGSATAEQFRQHLELPESGPIEVHTFFGFVQEELSLFWAAIQAAEPALKAWVRPEYLSVDLALRLMAGKISPVAFQADLLAPPERIAAQLIGHLNTVAAAAGLTVAEAVERLRQADRPEKGPVYHEARRLLESFQEESLAAGMLDYGLALRLFSRVLMKHAPYREHLLRRFRYLMVDDLDESTPAAQAFLAAMAGEVTEAVFAFGLDGGQSVAMGADPAGALARFRPGAEVVELPGSYTCGPDQFRFGEALYQRITAEEGGSLRGYGGIVSAHIATDLHGDMLEQVVAAVEAILAQGVPPEQVAVLTPRPDQALEALLVRALGAVRSLRSDRRLLDDPYVRSIVVLAELVQPHARLLPEVSAGAVGQMARVLLGLDPIRAAMLGEAVHRAGELPDPARLPGLGLERSPSYRWLREWVAEARGKESPPDLFARDALAEVVVPLAGVLPLASLDRCRQFVLAAHRYARTLERFGAGAFGAEYVRLLTESALPATELSSPHEGKVALATPAAYLNARLTSQAQVWVDISSDGWCQSDVKELANPYVLAPGWPAGQRWSDRQNRQARLAAAARTARALIRRCFGPIVLAECGMSAFGHEQDGGLAEAFADLVRKEVG